MEIIIEITDLIRIKKQNSFINIYTRKYLGMHENLDFKYSEWSFRASFSDGEEAIKYIYENCIKS